MTVITPMRPRSGREHPPAPPRNDPDPELDHARSALARSGRALSICLGLALAAWLASQAACILSLFGYTRFGAASGMIDGTQAFRFCWPFDYINPDHARIDHFVPITPDGLRATLFAAILVLASTPLVAAVWFLLRLLEGYRCGRVFDDGAVRDMRHLAIATLLTGTSPFVLAPFAHWIGMLRPVTGVTGTMIGVTLLGLVLLVLSRVIAIGRHLHRELELFL